MIHLNIFGATSVDYNVAKAFNLLANLFFCLSRITRLKLFIHFFVVWAFLFSLLAE